MLDEKNSLAPVVPGERIWRARSPGRLRVSGDAAGAQLCGGDRASSGVCWRLTPVLVEDAQLLWMRREAGAGGRSPLTPRHMETHWLKGSSKDTRPQAVQSLLLTRGPMASLLTAGPGGGLGWCWGSWGGGEAGARGRHRGCGCSCQPEPGPVTQSAECLPLSRTEGAVCL